MQRAVFSDPLPSLDASNVQFCHLHRSRYLHCTTPGKVFSVFAAPAVAYNPRRRMHLSLSSLVTWYASLQLVERHFTPGCSLPHLPPTMRWLTYGAAVSVSLFRVWRFVLPVVFTSSFPAQQGAMDPRFADVCSASNSFVSHICN